MAQLNSIFSFIKSIQRLLMIKDSVTVSLLSGFLGTLVMDASNLFLWKARKTETMYGHIAGSVLVHPFRTNQRKNFWLGEVMHLITGSALAYPLNYIFQKTGKDNYALKGAFFGTITWELIYGIGRRFGVFSVKPHFTKTHYAELLNNILYGISTAQALVFLSAPSLFSVAQNEATTPNIRNSVQPIYSDINSSIENTMLM